MLKQFKKIFSKNTILKSFLLPHIFTMVVPIVLITAIMFQINFNMYKKEIAERTKSGIESLRQVMDIETEGLMYLAGKIFSDSELMDTEQVSVSNMRLFQSKLDGYIGANNFISEVAVYNPKLDYVFSSQNSMSLSHYFVIMYEAVGYSAQDFRDFLGSKEIIRLIPIRQRINSSREIYAYVVKETTIYSSNNRLAIFMLDASYIGSLLKNIDGDSYVFDGNGYCIAQNTENYRIPSWEISKLEYKDGEKLKLNNDVYYISSVCSDSVDWCYVFVSEYADTHKNLLLIQWIYTFVILMVVIGGVFVTVYSIKKIYNPIRSLALRLEKSNDDVNELEAINNNINYLVKTKDDLEKKVEDAYAIAKEHMFYKLVNGEFSDEAEVKSKFAFYDVSFDFDYYYIALFEIDEYVPELVSDVVKLLVEYIAEYNCLSVTVFENRKLCIICPAMSDVHTDYDHNLIANLQNFLEEMMTSRITVGVGNPVSDVSTVWKSYIEAKSAGDYKKSKGIGKIIFFSDISTDCDKDKYVYRDMKKIPTYIKAGEIEKTFEQIDNIVNSLYDAPLTASQCVCFELIIVILKAVSDKFGSEYEELYLSRFDITTLVNFESIDVLVSEVKKFLRDVFDEISKESAETDSFIDQIVEYIENNYNSPHFSVDGVARHFGVSATYLGQYFKMKKGTTMSAYVAKVQIDNAKRILLDTDKTIKEIADDIGFTEVSNFIRKFKAQTGVTPGLYRKANKKEG